MYFQVFQESIMPNCQLQKSWMPRQKHGINVLQPLASKVTEMLHLESGSNLRKMAEAEVDVEKKKKIKQIL